MVVQRLAGGAGTWSGLHLVVRMRRKVTEFGANVRVNVDGDAAERRAVTGWIGSAERVFCSPGSPVMTVIRARARDPARRPGRPW